MDLTWISNTPKFQGFWVQGFGLTYYKDSDHLQNTDADVDLDSEHLEGEDHILGFGSDPCLICME